MEVRTVTVIIQRTNWQGRYERLLGENWSIVIRLALSNVGQKSKEKRSEEKDSADSMSSLPFSRLSYRGGFGGPTYTRVISRLSKTSSYPGSRKRRNYSFMFQGYVDLQKIRGPRNSYGPHRVISVENRIPSSTKFNDQCAKR